MNYITYSIRKWSRGNYVVVIFGQTFLIKGKRNLNKVLSAFDLLGFKTISF